MKYSFAAVLLLNFICVYYAASVFETSNTEPTIEYYHDSDSEETKVEDYASPQRERSRTEPYVQLNAPKHLESPHPKVRKTFSSDDSENTDRISNEKIIYFVEKECETGFKPRHRSSSFFFSSSSSAESTRNISKETFEGFEWATKPRY